MFNSCAFSHTHSAILENSLPAWRFARFSSQFSSRLSNWAQLFERRLALPLGEILIQVSFSCHRKQSI